MSKSSKNTKATLLTLRYFWREIFKYKWYSLGAVISTPIVIYIRAILGPIVFAEIIQRISMGLSADQVLPTLGQTVFTYFLLQVLSSLILEKFRLYCVWKMELLATYNLSSLAFNTISAQSMQFHNDRFSGSLVSQASRFANSFERFMDSIIWSVIPFFSHLFFIILVLWPTVPLFVVAILLVVIIYTLISYFTIKPLARLNEAESAAITKQTGQITDAITNILSVKSYAREAHERRRFANSQRAVLNAGRKVMFAFILRDFLFGLVIIFLLFSLLVFLLFGSAWFGISVATMILIISYSQQIVSSLWDINRIFKDFSRVFGDAREMVLILDMIDDVVDAPAAKPLKIKSGGVNFKEVTFCHRDAKEAIFQQFSLSVQPGERIGLVGVSGSGKTTLTKLLLRFADVSSGQITIDEQDISKVTQTSLRESIAYVPQETALFHRTIAENIAYGKPSATPVEIQRAAKLANAHNFIQDLPNGYETMVGERGIKLSGGQRQRIAIARAILKDAPILVLDEATSALDSESESLIQDALTKLMHGRTSIVIAHRLSTVASLDRIVVLKDGEILEQGSHQELLQRSGGAYHKLWSRQSGAFKSEATHL